MKRIISAVLCALLLAVCCTALAGSAGTASDPLISLSYINDTFTASVLSDGRASVTSALGAVYAEKVGVSPAANAASAAGSIPDGYSPTDGGAVISLSAGGSVSLASGSTLSFLSGSGTVSISDGTVKRGVRCLCAENTLAVFTASSEGRVLVNGWYKTGGVSAPASSSLPFSDVSESQWFYDAVSFVYKNGYMNGISDTAFGVSDYTTRAVFVTALYRMAGSPQVTETSRFPDVADSSLYYYKPVIWSNANGIVLGHDDGLFRPGDSITREQMAAIMHRFVKYAGYDVSNTDPAVFDSFPDKASVNPYAAEPMKWATANRIINGMDGTLNPGGTAIRAQIAQIILNFYQYMA